MRVPVLQSSERSSRHASILGVEDYHDSGKRRTGLRQVGKSSAENRLGIAELIYINSCLVSRRLNPDDLDLLTAQGIPLAGKGSRFLAHLLNGGCCGAEVPAEARALW